MQNTFSQSGNDSKWFLKKSFSIEVETPPLHGKIHLKFPFDYLHPSLRMAARQNGTQISISHFVEINSSGRFGKHKSISSIAIAITCHSIPLLEDVNWSKKKCQQFIMQRQYWQPVPLCIDPIKTSTNQYCPSYPLT